MLFAKKSLGQNFLKSQDTINKIVETARVTRDDIVLEIGPGKGILTQRLLEKAGIVIAIEKDKYLTEILQKKFSKEIEGGKLEIINGDILDFDLSQASLTDQKFKLVANIPYYITGQILRLFLSGKFQPSLMVLMLQKEVVERITGYKENISKKNNEIKKESLLSISVKVYGEPVYIKTVPAKFFSPQPKVDSAILLIENISKDFFTKSEIIEIDFFEILKQGFSHKRKVLTNNIKNLTPELLEKIKLSPKARAENLSVENWKDIYKILSDNVEQE
jgi:16S rRNA (adenine1518-N6/adenine1519-N6)-dimethyltransferase